MFALFDVTKNRVPTDEPIYKYDAQHNKKPLVSPSSVIQVPVTAPRDWGKHATEIFNRVGIHPKIIVGPIEVDTVWVDEKPATVTSARIAVLTAQSVRGGDSSYWSKMIDCSGFSVATPAVNRRRFITAMAAGVLSTDEEATVQIETETGDIAVVDASLQKLGFKKTRINFLVTSSTKVTMANTDVSSQLRTVAMPDSTLVKIAKIAMPGLNKKEEPDVKFKNAMTTFKETVLNSSFIIAMPIMTEEPFKWGSVVKYRPPYDMTAIVTSNPHWVQEHYFPYKTIEKTYEDFVVSVIRASRASLSQICDPLRIRTKSLALLNILVSPGKNVRIKLNPKTREYESLPAENVNYGDDEEDEGDGYATSSVKEMKPPEVKGKEDAGAAFAAMLANNTD